jgi:hypothetical protein
MIWLLLPPPPPVSCLTFLVFSGNFSIIYIFCNSMFIGLRSSVRTTGQKAWHSVYSVEGDFHLLKLFLPAFAAAARGRRQEAAPCEYYARKKLSHFGQEIPVYSTHTLLQEDKQPLICQSLKGQHRINNWSRNVNRAVYQHQAMIRG